MVVKQGPVWKIDTVESLEGNNKWTPDILKILAGEMANY